MGLKNAGSQVDKVFPPLKPPEKMQLTLGKDKAIFMKHSVVVHSREIKKHSALSCCSQSAQAKKKIDSIFKSLKCFKASFVRS